MTQLNISLIALHRKIEALEFALSITISSISTINLSIKKDVVGNLNSLATRYETNDETISSALFSLSEKIHNLEESNNKC